MGHNVDIALAGYEQINSRRFCTKCGDLFFDTNIENVPAKSSIWNILLDTNEDSVLHRKFT